MKYFIILFVLFFFSCEYSDKKLKIANKTSFPISYAIKNDFNSQIKSKPDFFIRNYIPADSSSKIMKFGGKHKWVQFLNEGSRKSLYIYIFNRDSLIKHKMKYNDLNALIEKQLYFKVLTFNSNQLDSLDWTIIINE